MGAFPEKKDLNNRWTYKSSAGNYHSLLQKKELSRTFVCNKEAGDGVLGRNLYNLYTCYIGGNFYNNYNCSDRINNEQEDIKTRKT